jgi:hypothetical protein
MSVGRATTAMDRGVTLALARGRFGFNLPQGFATRGERDGGGFCVVGGRAGTAEWNEKVSQLWSFPSPK